MATTFGVSADPNEVVRFVSHYIKLNLENVEKGIPRFPICIWGRHGIGKTEIIKSLPETGIVDYVVDLPIAQIEEMGDFHGLPIHKEIDGRAVTITAPPSWVPISDKPGILLIDDWNRADIRIIRGTMQLLQNHRMISWDLPKKCIIVLTTNPEDDDYIVTSVDRAMLTRIYHITMVPEMRAWLKWGESHEVDSRVLSFIARYKEQLMPEGSLRTCPRSWAMFGYGIRGIKQIHGAVELIRLHGHSVLDPEAVDNFIVFAEGALEWVVEPFRIANEYDLVREDVLKPIKRNRLDMFYVMMERLIAYLGTLDDIPIGSPVHRNIIRLLEEPVVPKEIKLLSVRQLCDIQSKSPLKDKIISATLTAQIGRVLTPISS